MTLPRASIVRPRHAIARRGLEACIVAIVAVTATWLPTALAFVGALFAVLIVRCAVDAPIIEARPHEKRTGRCWCASRATGQEQ